MIARNNRRSYKTTLKVIVAALAAAGFSSAFAASGQFTYVTGNVTILRGGQILQATRNLDVNEGDVVVTGVDGMAQLAMVDNARLSLRSNSRLTVEKYSKSKDENEGAVLNLARGTLRAFTSFLNEVNKSKYQMKTRVATVGIRGSGNILNQDDDDKITTNYTIEGSHIVSSNEGGFGSIITNPNETVQVVLGQAPKIIPTPPSLLEAAKTMVGKGSGASRGQNNDDDSGSGPGVQAGTIGPLVGGNGLGFSLVDATGNLGSDPINLQNISIAANGTTFSDQAVPGQITLENGSLRSYVAYAGSQSGTSLNINGGTVADLQTVTIGGSTTIVLGRYSNVSGLGFSGGTGAVNAGGIHWIYGGSGFPSYLSDVLTGTASYTRVAATTPTNQSGTLGQLLSSVLDVNFTARTLNATIGVGMSGATWTMQATNVPFALNSFVAYSGGGGLVVTNGAGRNSNNDGRITGALEGSFVGSTLNGAILGYGLSDQSGATFQNISGAVAFQGPSQNAAAQYRDGLVSDPANRLAVATYLRSYATTNRPEEVTLTGNQGVATAFAAPTVVGNQLVGHSTYAQGTASVVDNGFDPTTGLVWGRWSGGTATIGGQSTSLANASQHYVFGAAQSGPVSLPLTGTATYDVVGSTRPTDISGHTGTLNSAALNANFSARTVDASVNVGINGQTWNGVANAVPIYRDQYFSAYGGGSVPGIPRPSQFVITCSPNCTPTIPTGSLDGFFTGRAGRGAGVMYNLNNISGAVAFVRRGG